MMKFSRRSLLLGASLLAISRSSEAGINNPGSASSQPVNPVPTGKINLGLTGPGIQQNASPFINLWKSANSQMIYTQTGVSFTTATPQGTTDAFAQASAYPLFADANGENVVPQPAGTSRINRTIWQFSTPTGSDIVGHYPPQYAGQQFTVDWTGATDWNFQIQDANGGLLGQGTSSFTFTWPTTYVFGGAVTLIYVDQFPGTLSNPPRNIRIYKTNFAVGGKTGAQRLAAGEVLDPDYAAQIASGSGTFRCMDWMQTINSNLNAFSKIVTEASNFWGTGGSSGLRGMPLSVIVKTAKLTNKNPHICIPGAMMCKNYINLISITRATSPVVTTNGPHSWANGDLVILNNMNLFGLINPTSYASSTFTTSAPHGMVNGYPLMLGLTSTNPSVALDGSTYPTPIQKDFGYYACNVTATTFQIATTQANALAGTNMVLSGSMTGTINLYLDMNLNQYTVSNSNPSGNTFQLTGPGADTTLLTSSNLLGGFSMSPYDITYINTQVGLLAGYFRDNLPLPFCPTYELDNEVWNFGTQNFFSFNGQARWGGSNGKFVDSVNQVVGYMQGVFGQAVKTAYASDRTRYKMVFGGNQMYGDLFGAGLQSGWLKYVADNPGVVATDLFDYLLGNTYFGASYFPNGSPQTCTFGTNTIAYAAAKAGFPVKLATTGALPAGLVAGTLGTAAASPSSSQIIGTISGNVLTVIANVGNGNSGGSILAGSTLVLPDVLPAGTTIAAYGTGGTTGVGGRGTYQISNSVTVASPTVFWCGTPFVPGTGTLYWLVGTGPNFGLALTPGGSPVSFTGPGTGTHTATRCPNDVIYFLVTQSLALHASTPVTYPTPYTFYNQSLSDDNFDARWTAGNSGLDPLGLNFDYSIKAAINSFQYYYNTYLAPGKLLAGLSQTSYEGGFNGAPIAGFLVEQDPTWQVMYYNQNYCAGAGTNMAQMDSGCRAVTNGFYKTSQFLDSNPWSVNINGGIYGSKEYIGDNNLRWQGVVATNNN